ncbi:hypothetical protein [Luteolibacter sp. AS25]|uniref:hypothetical protein n=1 Tax=Luteolibacter sp. AS25 TaxID=3135776 RepID=UPI00398B6B55
MKILITTFLLVTSCLSTAAKEVTVFQIDRAVENEAHWEHSIKNEMRVAEPEASVLTDTLTEVGEKPPGLLDTLDFLCGVEIESKLYVVTVLYQRGIEVQQAALVDGKIRLKGQSAVLGKLPKTEKILRECFWKMFDQTNEKKKDKEQNKAEMATPRKPSD